nr:hypothetical protein [Tanacetum cinerariifolium]
MNYLEEQTDGEPMINCIKNDDQPLPRVTQVSIAGTSSTEQPPMKDKSMWSDQEKKIQKMTRTKTSSATEGELFLDTYIRYLQVINDLKKCVYSKDNYELNIKFLNNLQPEWKQYATMMRQNNNLMDININALYKILKQNQGDVNDAMGLKKKTVVVTSDPLALIAEKIKVSKRKEKVVVSLDSKGSDADDFSELKKITTLLAKAFNRRKFYSKPTNNNLRTSSTSQSANKKQEYVKSDDKKVEKNDDEKKVKDYEYYKTKMLLAKKDKDKQVLLAEDHAWMESSSDSDQEINANMVFMAQIEKVLFESEAGSSSADDKIFKVSYYLSESKSESEYETSEYYDNSTTYGLFVNDNDDQEIFHDCENFSENLIESQIDHNESAVDHNDYEGIYNAFDCNNARNALCNARMNASVDVKDLFVLDDVSIRKSHVSKMPFRKKPSASLNVPSRSKLNKCLPRIMCKWLPKLQPLAEPIAKWIPRIVQICLWIIDSGCSKHMTGIRALLRNFVEKFLRTVRFGNNDFTVIAGYGDMVIGSMTIKKVYYVEGLGHNLFSVGQFCDKGHEFAFRKSTCFVRTEDGVDLLTGDRSSNLYTIALNEVASNYLACLIAMASSLQSWLWHQYISHFNFATINKLVKNNLVQGLPKMKFKKYHLCFACEQGKIHQKHHKSKTAFASNKPLYLLHMDLCGPMRIHVRIDNGTEFKNKTLAKFFDEVSITQQFSAARTPQQNGVVERRNRTLVEAARTMLTFANLPLFLWAEAIAITTQNRSIIPKRFDKTPYELMNKRKPNIKFFYVFGCRCYLLNDCDD